MRNIHPLTRRSQNTTNKALSLSLSLVWTRDILIPCTCDWPSWKSNHEDRMRKARLIHLLFEEFEKTIYTSGILPWLRQRKGSILQRNNLSSINEQQILLFWIQPYFEILSTSCKQGLTVRAGVHPSKLTRRSISFCICCSNLMRSNTTIK